MVDASKLERIRNWIDTNFDLFYINTKGPNRLWYQIKDYDTYKYPEEFLDIKYELMDLYNVPLKAESDISIHDTIGIQYNGAFTHIHIDTNYGDDVHFRINVLASKPIGGGMPIINNEIINVEEGEPWICYSGLEMHSTTPVVGDKVRILLTYGFTLPKDDPYFDGIWTDYRKEMLKW